MSPPQKKEKKSQKNQKKIRSKKSPEKIRIKSSEKFIVTAALPYANGPIHVGHLLEYIQADIFSRFLKLQGKDALYICASDMHGTPIEVNAKKAGETPEIFVEKFWKEHQEDFASYLIAFDNFYKTHSSENKILVENFFSVLKKKGFIFTKKVNTIYCSNCMRYLPDRYVRGTCPNCSIGNQYGDICESCSSTLKGIDLINPRCVLCGKNPVQKESMHYFFKLSVFAEKIKDWLKSADLQQEVVHQLKEWLDKGLEDWCISRDAPYFGFEIPYSEKETGEKKFFYVWLDAPIGYISATQNYCKSNSKGGSHSGGESNSGWERYWKKGKTHHFIGKDIMYFHFLFWPALLLAMDIPLPSLTVHGFITMNGEKMSKSRGTFFTAKEFLALFPAEALRFFYASHLDRKIIDINLDFEELKEVNNNVLLGSLGNFCYRVLTFAKQNYGGTKEIAQGTNEKELQKKAEELQEHILNHYPAQDFKSVVKEILALADLGNSYFQKAEPWKNKAAKESKAAVGFCVNLAKNLAVLISPILPEFSTKIAFALGKKTLARKDINFSWKGKINLVERLVEKVEKIPSLARFPLRMMVGRILEVKNHPQADSLYLLQVDLGKEFGKKQVVAGLRKHISEKQLLNCKAVFCVNIKPAVIRGEKSEAMILAAEDDELVALLNAEKSKEGEEVKFLGMEPVGEEMSFEEFKKLTLEVYQGRVWFEKKKLLTSVEEVVVHGIRDGGKVR